MANRALSLSLQWQRLSVFPYCYVPSGDTGLQAFLTMNDFPDENLATLFVGNEVVELEELPDSWNLLPPHFDARRALQIGGTAVSLAGDRLITSRDGNVVNEYARAPYSAIALMAETAAKCYES